ncbi:MAG: putative cysteine desulfurase [Candidatus Heimdallarchaeota archaeon LC_3]|nr:MAG: putative cysteine desulfurase [Candidatus Heimdallarchaeota archaeon LC_3]
MTVIKINISENIKLPVEIPHKVGFMLTLESVRKDFPILERKVHNNIPLVYLDNAATSQKPKSVVDAISNYYLNYNANVHRGVHTLSEEASNAFDDARIKVKNFINAKNDYEIIFSRNTSESLNLVAWSFPEKFIKKGDYIITSVAEHHSNIVTWQQVAKRTGAILDLVGLTDDYRLNIDQLKGHIEEKQPKLVAVSHMSNVLGAINPVKDIAKWTHDIGGYIVVDGAQSAPHIPVDVQDLDLDFFAASGHKMCGPFVGFLYGKEDLLNQMEPMLFGGEMIKEVHRDSSKWNDIPFKFEAGTPSIAETIGLGAAIDYLTKLTMEWVAAHEHDITEYFLKRLAEEADLIKLIGPSESTNRGAVFSFTMDPLHPHDVAQVLDSHGIAIRSGLHCAQPLHEELVIPATSRASFYLYNTKDEVDFFFDSLKKVKDVFT